MIAFIRGELIRSSPSEVIIVCNGVGYHIHIPLSTYKNLPLIGSPCDLEIVTHFTKDSIVLVGFLTEQEKNLFKLLNQVRGVGLKSALNILGNITTTEFVHAIRNKDLNSLSRVQGIGKKTAERIILECKDKMEIFAGIDSSEQPVSDRFLPDDPVVQDVYSVLLNLGFKPAEARQSLLNALTADPSLKNEQHLIKYALRSLHKGI